MNRLLQLGWALRRRIIGALGLRTRGVKVMLLNGRGELLLIRNAYGDTRAFVLPGGGVGWSEDPLTAAARELDEEVGITGVSLQLVGSYESVSEGKRDSISVYRGVSDRPAVIDGREIAEARFVPLDALPEGTSPATRRRIQEWLTDCSLGGTW